jgi:hypothetical protein
LTKQLASEKEWITFIENAIGGLRQAAEQLQQQKAHFEAKRDWFRRRKTGIPRENSVSRALAELFQQIRSQQVISGSGVQSLDLRHISIQCERPRPHDPGISDEANPTDFSLVLLKNNELDLRIEAKTVLNDAEVRAEYVGVSGLQRFDDSANPYTIQPFGGMVAYVVDSDAKTWTTKIQSEVLKAVGASRSHSIKIGKESHPVSKHHLTLRLQGRTEHYDVDVVHFALEIDSKPPQR